MNGLWIVAGAGFLLCLLAFLYAIRNAPTGYEDESGFHFGNPPRKGGE